MQGLCDTYVKNIPWGWYEQHIESPAPTEVRAAKARFDAQAKKVEGLENRYLQAQSDLRKDPGDGEANITLVASRHALAKEHACLYRLNLRLIDAMDQAQGGN